MGTPRTTCRAPANVGRKGWRAFAVARSRAGILFTAVSVAVLINVVPAATADLQPDQVNDTENGIVVGCENGSVLYQGFLPSRRLLAAVTLIARAGPAYPAGGISFPVRIHEGSPSGTVVGTATAASPAGLAKGTKVRMQAQFTPPIALEPAGTFVIEGLSGSAKALGWSMAAGAPYTRGTPFGCNGNPVTDWDLAFVTYTPPDSAEPETRLTDAPAANSISSSRREVIGFTGTDDLSYSANLVFRCSLDDQPSQPCTSPITADALADGIHTFTVAAGDESGRTDSSPASIRWQVDATPPSTVKVSGPRRTRLARPTYSFAAKDAMTASGALQYRCAIDSTRLSRCARKFRPLLRIGPHVLRVAAVDRAGNRGRISSVRIVRVA